MGSVKRVLKKVRKMMPDSVYIYAFRPLLQSVLNYVFGEKGCKINIGGEGIFRLSSRYYFRGLEDFGDLHNRGFKACIEACRGKSVFFDVGAHIGLYSLPASRALGPYGQVISFEPSESNYQYLIDHIRYNDIVNITPHQLAVGKKSQDEVPFFEHMVSGSPFGGFVVNSKKSENAFVRKTVRQICLDDFCVSSQIEPDVIKIDVEGAELGVLKGAKRTLSRGNPMIFLSVHPSHLELMGQSVKDIMELLEELEYEVFSVAWDKLNAVMSGENICIKKGKTDNRLREGTYFGTV